MVKRPFGLFSPGLQLKITLPYVLLAIALALAALYIVAQMEARSLATAFNEQLADAHLRVSDSIVRTEQQQIAHARTLARTTGLALALRTGDAAQVSALIEPYAASQGIEHTLVLDVRGRELARVQARPPARPAEPAGWAPVQAVLAGRVDAQGDKYVGLVDDGGTPVLYTSAPIVDDSGQAGVLLVGTSARTLAERWRGSTLADVTLYSASGAPLTTSLGDQPPAPLAEAQNATAAPHRTIALGSRRYIEALSPLVLRGVQTPHILGVSLPNTGRAGLARETSLLLLMVFSAGLIATVLLGTAVTGLITRPVTALVHAAEQIAAGNLNQEVRVRSHDEIGVLERSFNDMLAGLRERERMHDLLGRFVSRPIAQLVLSRPLDLGGEIKTLTILFTDLRDFTAMSEREEPLTVIRGLNAYFQIVVEAAERHGGVVNKFGGDSTLVLFGLTDPEDNPSRGAAAAVQAAREIRARLRELNDQRAVQGEPLLLACIGINTGPAVAGLIGSERRMEYTVIGDSVNLSARIQALNRDLDSEILISHDTYMALGQPDDLPLTDHGLCQVKGKRNGVRVYALEGPEVHYA